MAVSDTSTLQPISGRASLRSYLGQIWERREFIATMPRHELHAENLDTALGNFWLLLNPLLLSAVYWLVFGALLDRLTDLAGQADLVLQVLTLDPQVPGGIEFSNAVLARFGR